MSSINTTQVVSNNSEALLAFTTLTAQNLLNCSASKNCRSLPPLNDFIQDLYSRTTSKRSPNRGGLSCAVKLFTLIYLFRLKSKLPDNAKGGFDTPYRLFLAAVLASSKYLSETGTGLTSTHLSALTNSVYSPKDINQMERSFLGLICYDLWVSAQDIQSFIKLYGDLIQVDICNVNLPQQPIAKRCNEHNIIDTIHTNAAITATVPTDSTTNTSAATATKSKAILHPA
ncbi:hypothetical protein [Parasitella parasitica]|uniref:Cyclin N-terminal domain-containing protein n=1 Tax=Parasitella parasitica TaxID=35722 RepID=A0A0B7MYL5_9FUNG|nr:hypothetical protein [Parasitella parasitica]